MSLELGPFELVSLHAQGGMSEVWRGRHRLSGGAVAIKAMTLAATRPPSWRRQFAREVRAVARVDHPAVVRVYDHGVVPEVVARQTGRLGADAPYLVMEWLDGGPISAGPAAEGWTALRKATLTLLDGLALAHARGVIHRDIKPDNVLLSSRGPVLTDFGLALEGGLGEGRLAGAGTPGYMAPEQIEGHPHLEGPATDLYAVGCLVWALATGLPPHAKPDLPWTGLAMAHLYEALPVFEPAFAVPDGLAVWLARILARDPAARFSSAAEATLALREWTAPGNAPEPVHPTVPGDWRGVFDDTRPPEMLDAGNTMLGHRVPPPVGRERARDRLWSALRTVAREGGVHGRCISGRGGLGKSHLADWLAEQAHRLGVALALRASHGDPQGPGCGLRPMLARTFGADRLTGDRNDPRLAEAIDARLPVSATDAERAEAAALVDPDGIGHRGDERVNLRTQGDWDQAFVRLLRTLGRDRPIVMVLDDLQWGSTTRRTLRALRQAWPSPPLLVITTLGDDAGPQVDETRALFEPADIIELGPLTRSEHRRLLGHVLPLDRSALDVLVERADGSPLVGVEWLRHWIDGGVLLQGPRGYRLAPGAALAPPEGIENLWVTRLNGVLGPLLLDAREALEIGAVLGQEMPADIWLEACGHAGVPWPAEALNRLLDAGLLVEATTGRMTFAHGMLRETFTGWARRGGRWLALNACCARVYERRAERGVAIDLSRLAGHLIAAGEHTAALVPLSTACRRAIAAVDLDAAARLVTRQTGVLRHLRVSWRDPRWIPVLLDAARLDQYRGRYARARRRALRMARHPAIAADPALHCRALHVLSYVDHYTDGPRRAMPHIDQAMPLAEASGDRTLLAWQLALFGINAILLYRVREAEDALSRGLAVVPSDDDERRAYLHSYRALAASMRGRTGDGVTAAHAARRAFRAAGQTANVASTWFVESDLHRRAGRLDDARACADRARALLTEPRPVFRAYGALCEAMLAIADGNWREARPLVDEVDGLGVDLMRLTVALSRACIFAGRGRWADAEAIIETVDAMLDDAPASYELPWLAARLGDVARAAGELAVAATAARWQSWHRRRLDADARDTAGPAAMAPDDTIET